MAVKCERCGQMVLPDETVCWQCGARLLAAPETARSSERKEETQMPTLSFSTLAYLAVTTAVILLLLIVMMWLLAQQPLL